MITLSSNSAASRTVVGAVAVGGAPALALAHETGAPHGAIEHAALYAGAAILLGLAGLGAALATRRGAARRIRVERDRRDHRRPR